MLFPIIDLDKMKRIKLFKEADFTRSYLGGAGPADRTPIKFKRNEREN